ncbi:MAG TPA: aldose 1-epimerase family protein [Planctomycetaceae bacterium]|nr:aldose 1-epimerase family protein [Planctomycetaceae bacterium]
MTVTSFDLLDVSAGIGKASWNFSSDDGIVLPGSEQWRVELRRIRGGRSDNLEIITLDNGALEIEVITTRGMGIWRGSCQGHRLGWDSPVKQPVHPAFVRLESRNHLGWLDGFNEWLCRCGLAFNGPPGPDDDGSPITLHGRIANLPADKVWLEIDDSGSGSLKLTGIVDEVSMFGTNLRLTSSVTLTAGQPVIQISDTITNLGSAPQEYEMLYHLNQGTPFLAGGAEFLTAFREMAPRDKRAAEDFSSWNKYEPPTTGYTEQVYFFDPLTDDEGKAHVLLKNSTQNLGLGVRFETATLPYLAVWKATQDERDGYVTGLEPCTDFPNHRSFERREGRLKKLFPDESVTLNFEIEAATNAERLAALEQSIHDLQATTKPTIHEQPLSRFSPR